MKKLIALVFLLAGIARAQTTVTATVSDINGNLYANGTVSAYTVVNTGQASITISPVIMTNVGTFSLSLASNLTYVFTVCAPPVLLGQQSPNPPPLLQTGIPSTNPAPQLVCFASQPIAISGATQDISGQLSAAAAVLGPKAVSGGIGNGGVSPSNTSCNTFYTSTAQVSGDCLVTDDGSGNFGANSVTVTGPGTAAITFKNGLAPANPNSGNSTIYTDNSTGAFHCVTTGGVNCLPGTGGAPIGAAFYATTNCAGLANCVQLVDDDATNNCGTPFTNWVALVNAYAGSGQPYVYFVMSGAGKAFLFSTCQISATISWVVNATATFDIGTNSNANFINFGLGSTCSTNKTCAPFRWTGGTFIGGASLTNAVIEIKPNANDARINSVQFINVGAGNATLGSCTNYAVLFDNPIAGGVITDSRYLRTDAVTGWCAFANPSGAGGTNTIQYINNVIGSGGGCGSVGILEGGNYGYVFGGAIFGAALAVRLVGVGHRIQGVELDVNSCAAHGVQAPIQWGGSSAVNVWGISISHNVFQSETGATGFFQKAGDDAGSNLYSISVIDNKLIGRSGGTNTLVVNSPCTLNGSTSPGFVTDLCYEAGNIGMPVIPPCLATSTNTGWLFGQELASCTFNNNASNLTAQGLFTEYTQTNNGFNYLTYVGCQVTLTQAATTSSTLPQCQVTWTDNKTNTVQTSTITPVWASGTNGCSGTTTNTIGILCAGVIGPITPKVGTAVQIQTINFASTGATGMQFQAIATAYIAY